MTTYTFYNPTQHPFFDQDKGRQIYFEGTYVKHLFRRQRPDTALQL